LSIAFLRRSVYPFLLRFFTAVVSNTAF